MLRCLWDRFLFPVNDITLVKENRTIFDTYICGAHQQSIPNICSSKKKKETIDLRELRSLNNNNHHAIIISYYMAGSASGQDEANPVF